MSRKSEWSIGIGVALAIGVLGAIGSSTLQQDFAFMANGHRDAAPEVPPSRLWNPETQRIEFDYDLPRDDGPGRPSEGLPR